MKVKDLVRINYSANVEAHGLEGTIIRMDDDSVVIQLIDGKTYQGHTIVRMGQNILDVVIPYCTCELSGGCRCGSFKAEQAYKLSKS